MKLLYEFLKAHILANVPEFKTVRLWRNQYERSNTDRDERAFRYPACFIEFQVDEIQNYGLGYRDKDIIVRFHMAFTNYQLEKEDDLDIRDKFDGAMMRFRGGENDPVQFTSMQKVSDTDLPDDNNVDLQIVEFRTKYREKTGLRDTSTIVAPVALDLDAEIIKEQSLYNIKTLQQQNEYLEHLGQLLPADTTTLDIELDFKGYVNTPSSETILSFGNGAFGTGQFEIRANTGAGVNIACLIDDGGGLTGFESTTPMPESGKIEIKGEPTRFKIFLDGTEILNFNGTWNFGSFPAYAYLSGFGISTVISQVTNITWERVRIQNDVWTFPEGEGSVTGSNTAKVFTLNSDSDVNNMWVLKDQ